MARKWSHIKSLAQASAAVILTPALGTTLLLWLLTQSGGSGLSVGVSKSFPALREETRLTVSCPPAPLSLPQNVSLS